MFCCMLLYVHSSIAIILMGKKELVALLNLSSWCLVVVERLFLAVPRGCLQFVIVVFPDHTHLLIFDTVWRGVLFKKLEYMGIRGKILRVLENMYSEVNFSTKLPYGLTDLVSSSTRLKPFSRDLAIPHLDLSHFALCIMGN